MILKKLTFIFSIMLVIALISGCARDNRPTRAYYHYEELEQKEDEEDLQDAVDEIIGEGKSTLFDGQDPNDLANLEKILTPDLDD